MAAQTIHRGTGGEAGAIPAAILDNVAARFRPAGLFLVMLGNDGNVLYADSAAGLFFQRFVLPLLQFGRESDSPLRQRIGELCAHPSTAVLKELPGVILSVLPHAERRQAVGGVLLLAARSGEFRLDKDSVGLCGQLGLDASWLEEQAQALPIYASDAIQYHGRLMVGILRDQLRLAGILGELYSLSTQLSNAYEELSLIYQLSSGMRINRRPGDFFKQTCLDVLEVMGVKGLGVALAESNAPNAVHGRRQDPVLYGSGGLPSGMVHRLSRELLAQLSRWPHPVLVNDLARDSAFEWLHPHCRRLLAVPLQRQEGLLGCFFALDKSSGDFDSQDSKLLNSIANESAIFLENSMLYESSQELMMGLLHSLISAVDAKDAYTCGHSRRVAILGQMLCLEARLPDAFAERVYMAGLLHDVGKIGVPETVLQKTGKLTAEEFDQMKKHPLIGARIMQDLKQISDIIPAVLHHHERYDGGGYPEGLAGERIPVMGRIICLADSFDAMTSTRTYRGAMPLETALTEIRRYAGTQFDPTLAEALFRIDPDRLRALMLSGHEEQTPIHGNVQVTLRCA